MKVSYHKIIGPLRRRLWARVAAVCFIPLLSVTAQDGWVQSPRDLAWTNKPPGELQQAATRGDPTAQFYYARHRFIHGDQPGDKAESLSWLTRAAEAGVADAQFMAARFYMSGTGTARDPAIGFRWARKAADQGHPDGLALLADAYAFGSGTIRDVAQARELYQRAIDAGSILGLDWYGHFYMNGEGRTARKTNYVEALRCFERAASNGMAHAASHLIEMYGDGLGSPPNIERAVYWARVFADQHDGIATESLAGFYTKGLADPRNPQEAPAVLIRRVAEGRARLLEREHSAATPRSMYTALAGNCQDLWNRYRFGIGTARDYIAAAHWMLVAYREDVRHDRIMRRGQLNRLHPFAQAIDPTTRPISAEERLWQEAQLLVLRSLEEADGPTCRQIGHLYRDGSALTPQDNFLAHVWLARAAQMNESQAPGELTEIERTLDAEQIVQAKKRFLAQSRKTP